MTLAKGYLLKMVPSD